MSDQLVSIDSLEADLGVNENLSKRERACVVEIANGVNKLGERVTALERVVLAIVQPEQEGPSLEEQHRDFVERIRRSHPDW